MKTGDITFGPGQWGLPTGFSTPLPSRRAGGGRHCPLGACEFWSAAGSAAPRRFGTGGVAHPGVITSLAVGVGAKVAKDDKLVTMEAMKMQTTIYAQADGVVSGISAQVGETVESKDLLMKLKG
jgi:multidrug efflux pump subunit AcrA (membrane-fusion protein)